MKASIASVMLAVALLPFVSRETLAQSAPAYDVVIRNGRLLDGAGSQLVIDQGRHTGAKPGNVLRGGGYDLRAAAELPR